MLNNEIIDINNSDKNVNRFQERFILANIPKQNIKKIFNLTEVDDYKEKDLKENKYLIIIKNKDEIDIKKYVKLNINDKKEFKVSEEIKKRNGKNI